MAKPTRYAAQICLALTVIAGIGIVLGLMNDEVMWPIVLLVPTVAYEAYRTEGPSTRWASWLMAVLLVALIVVVVADIDYDVRELFGTGVVYVGGEDVPLGDLKVVFPAAMAILAALLWSRTRGVYTRWLAAIIFVTAAVIIFMRSPAELTNLLNTVG